MAVVPLFVICMAMVNHCGVAVVSGVFSFTVNIVAELHVVPTQT